MMIAQINCVSGVSKMNKTCSAFISATVDADTDEVKVDYCNHHVGHDFDPSHMRLSEDLKLKVDGR